MFADQQSHSCGCLYGSIESFNTRIAIGNVVLLREPATSSEPEDLEEELGKKTDISIDDLLKPPGPEEQEKEEEHERYFARTRKEIEEANKRVLKIQEDGARKEAQMELITASTRKSWEDTKSRQKENEYRRRQFEENLQEEDVKELIEKKGLLKQMQMNQRHRDFHSGQIEKYEALYNNFSHAVSEKQALLIRKHLQSILNLKCEDYITRVAMPLIILELFARFYKMSIEEAKKRLLDLGEEEVEGSPRSEQNLAEEKSRLEAEEKKAAKEAQAEKKKKAAEEAEKKKKAAEEAEKKKKADADAALIREMVLERLAGEKKRQPRRPRLLTQQKPR